MAGRGLHAGERKGGDDKRGTDETKEEKESLHKLLLQSVGQWSIVRA